MALYQRQNELSYSSSSVFNTTYEPESALLMGAFTNAVDADKKSESRSSTRCLRKTTTSIPAALRRFAGNP